ncbi:hypothetical protein [Sulfidibacter corallicola]|uniref:Poly(A) polymerase n=1 Tax=Sulfidibacter corallicola TaxID=2818388 RepID=A0A8A4TN69_SULCO|nr:hypothetical protein [Sulfidibacter corallicola]QTD50552.1 hypothetical protein J3U87_33630 [Sulfidibacter corallicola]
MKSKGYMAFLVGGALRDLMRDTQPRDYDVVTNASIEQIRLIFRNSKTIGKRFPIVHTYFAGDVIEISSLKSDDAEDVGESQRELLVADANLRDFTINAIYYDIRTFEVIDPLGAIKHLEEKVLVPIGDPYERFREDPVRMIRAVKLSERHGFTIEPELERIIHELGDTMLEIGPGRKYEELTRILLSDYAVEVVTRLRNLGVFRFLWPAGESLLAERGPAILEQARIPVPVHYSRGSFSKETHMKLWLGLFMLSGHQPGTSGKYERAVLDDFLDPLGMPFRNPVVDCLVCLGQLMAQKGAFGGMPLNGEVSNLVEFYVGYFDPKLSHQLEQFHKHHASAKKGRSRRPGEKGKPSGGKRPRGRRRRRRRPAK